MGLLLSKPMIYLGIVAVCLVALAVVARNWSCRSDPGPRTKTYGPYEVAECLSGASISVAKGWRGKRHEVVVLANVAAPAGGEMFFEESKAALATVAGQAVTVDVEKERILERVSKLDGEIYGESGQCLQLSQLLAGWVWCLPNAPKAYQTAQSEAGKAKRGIWQNFIGWQIAPDGTQSPMYEGDGPQPLTPDKFEAMKAELRFGRWMKTHCETCKECVYTPVRGGFPEWEAKCMEAIAKHEEMVKQPAKVTK